MNSMSFASRSTSERLFDFSNPTTQPNGDHNGNYDDEETTTEEFKYMLHMDEIKYPKYRYKELYTATKGFSEKQCIGKGTCNIVFKGVLNDTRVVAIKLRRNEQHDQLPGSRENEIVVTSALRHRNIVQLLGHASDTDRPALVYDFMPNGSLNLQLHSSLHVLPWEIRYWKIVMGLAHALLYLQEELDRYVVHGNIYPNKVLLDSSFNPKLGGFSFAERAKVVDGKVMSDWIGSSITVNSNRSYCAPEYISYGLTSKATDIFSFGAVVLEIATGRRFFDTVHRNSLHQWVSKLAKRGAILEAADRRLDNAFDEKEMEQLLLIGLWCTLPEPRSRPSIKSVLQVLNFLEPMSSSVLFQERVERPRSDCEAPPPAARGNEAATDDATSLASVREDKEEEEQEVEEEEKKNSEFVGVSEFDIGIPIENVAVARQGSMGGHRRYILNGFVGCLESMLESRDVGPRFDEVLKTIRTYTASLVLAIGPLLDDWNELAQLVLRAFRERDEFLQASVDGEVVLANVALSIVRDEIGRCESAMTEDAAELEAVNQRLVSAEHEVSALKGKLAEAESNCHAIKEEAKPLEKRLENKKRQLSILKLFESAHSKVSTFASGV